MMEWSRNPKLDLRIKMEHTLVKACTNGDVEQVKVLLAAGADPNYQAEIGWTPLHWACKAENSDVVECLLTAGAKPNIQENMQKQTPLMMAVLNGQQDIISKLISFGADVDLTDNNEDTALMAAAFRGDMVIINQLITAGACLDIANKNGDTALIMTAKNNHLEATRLLIHAGANLGLTNKEGYTARDIADMKDHTTVHEELLQAQGIENPIKKIDIDDVEFFDKLGKGGFGTVYKGQWKSRGLIVAIKNVKGVIREEEVIILNQLNHPNIVLFYGAITRKPDFLIVTEFVENGSLYDIIHTKQRYPDHKRCFQWAKEIAQGVKYLHMKKIIHRDLKSSNVLVTTDWTVKLCDFGAAKEFDHTTVQTRIGTLPWMSPEIVKKEPASLSCDVYSYGMVLYEIFTHKVPYADVQSWTLSSKIMNGELPTIPESCPSSLASLMHKCWKTNPKLRPTIVEVLLLLENEEMSASSFEQHSQNDHPDGIPDDKDSGKNVDGSKEATRQLTMADLPVLQSHLQSVVHLWYPIGMGLKLKPKDLRTIVHSAGGDTETCLLMVLKQWLDTEEPYSSVQCLVDCLSSPAVNEDELAHLLLETL